MPRIPLTLRRCMLLPMAGALASSVGVQAAELTFDLKIENGQVAQNMRLIRVKERDVVKLRWGTDQPLTLHLHGYDHENEREAQKMERLERKILAGLAIPDPYAST